MLFRLLFLLSSVVSAQIITGTIVSCSGWALNRLPELKSFLKDGEAESYHGVEIQYIHGKSAKLSIFHNGELQQEIPLSNIPSKDLMHSVMVEHGFVRKTDETLAKEKEDTMARVAATKAESDAILAKQQHEATGTEL